MVACARASQNKTKACNASNSIGTLHARLSHSTNSHGARLLFASASYFPANKSLKNEPAPSPPSCGKEREKKHLHLHIVRRAHCEVQSRRRRRRRQANVLRTKYIHRPPRRRSVAHSIQQSSTSDRSRIDARLGLSSNNTRRQTQGCVMHEGPGPAQRHNSARDQNRTQQKVVQRTRAR